MTAPHPPSLTLRPATEADVPWLLALRVRTMDAALAAAGTPLSEADHLARVVHDFEHIRVLLAAGAPVGMAKVVRSPGEWRLVQLQLVPEAQGRGLGSAYVRDLLAAAAAEGVVVTLEVLPANPARRLYRRLGFREVGVRDGSVQMQAEAGGGSSVTPP